MNKRKLNKIFAEIKEKADMDYAITNTDEYGDCNTCVLDRLADKFGAQSTGIYAKHWMKGMNASGPWSKREDVYISHDVTEEQAEIMIEVFRANGYDIQPKKYDPRLSFLIKEI